MPSPFPGMDPYLEHPARWPGFHHTLVSALQLHLAPRLRPRYLVRIERRTWMEESEDLVFVGQPDITVHRTAPRGEAEEVEERPATRAGATMVEIPMPMEVRETYLEIRAVPTGEVVTVVEILSPSNKGTGPGRDLYLQKRRAVLACLTHLVELDLVRIGDPPPYRGATARSDYRILVSRSESRPRAELFAFSVRDPIPEFALPLRSGDDEPAVDLRSLVDQVYDGAVYELELDYSSEPVPPFTEEDRVWADELLRDAGRRGKT